MRGPGASQGVSAQRRGAKLAGIFEASALGTGSSVDRDAEVAYMLSTDEESMLDGEKSGAENALQRVESRPEPAGELPQCGALGQGLGCNSYSQITGADEGRIRCRAFGREV